MYSERVLIKLCLLIERIHRLALDMALCAAELGEYGRGIVIVADESRNCAVKVQSFLDSDNLGDGTISDLTLQMRFLAVNACLEMLRLPKSNLQTKKKLAVILDEVRNTADDIAKAFNIAIEPPLVLPRVYKNSTVVSENVIMDSELRFVLFEIGGRQFCESTTNVTEIFLYPVNEAGGDFVKIQGEEIPLIHCYSKLGLSLPQREFLPLAIITAHYQSQPKQYAFFIDGVPDIFFTNIGLNVAPKDISPNFIRECWSCEEEKQMLFLEYDAILEA